MTLLQSWIDSLQLLKPKNLKLFVLVTLKSIGETYKIYFEYFWWLIILIPLSYLPFLTNYSNVFDMLEKPTFFFNIPQSSYLFQILLFFVCTIARSSATKKDINYFKSQVWQGIGFILLLGILSLLQKQYWFPGSFSAFWIFFILFFLDSQKGFKNFFLSAWYALKMIFFNLPLIALVKIFLYIFIGSLRMIQNSLFSFIVQDFGLQLYMFEVASGSMPQIFWLLIIINVCIGVLLIPIGVCTYANIYIKKVHDQLDLYFKA